MFGEISNVSVGGMLRLLSVFQQTGRLKVRGEDGDGEIFLQEGRIVGTSKPNEDIGSEVLRLLLLKKGFFHFQPMETIPLEKSQGIAEEVENLIMEASRRCDAKEATEYLPNFDTVIQLAPIQGNRTKIQINMERDEWNFMTHVNGEDPIQLLIEKSEMEEARCIQILYGLLSSGIVRKTRFRLPKLFEIANKELGNMGEALVRQAFRKLKLDQTRMHMRELIALLNELERSVTLLLGPTRASHIIGLMWEGAKR